MVDKIKYVQSLKEVASEVPEQAAVTSGETHYHWLVVSWYHEHNKIVFINWISIGIYVGVKIIFWLNSIEIFKRLFVLGINVKCGQNVRSFPDLCMNEKMIAWHKILIKKSSAVLFLFYSMVFVVVCLWVLRSSL